MLISLAYYHHREDSVSFMFCVSDDPRLTVSVIDPGVASLARFGGVMISYGGKEVNVSIY